MATVGVCLGLRWSEIVGLKWQDINWIDGELRLQRAVVKQIEDEVKTVHSSKPLALDTRILDLLMQHRRNSVFTAAGDWVFASPEKNGKLPRSYTSFWEKLGRACHDTGIVHVSPHSFRHSYRAWLDELGTPITVQQCAMRHGDIRVTMNYGDAVGEELRKPQRRLQRKQFPNEQQTERKPANSLKNWGGRRESKTPQNSKQKTCRDTDSKLNRCKYMKNQQTDFSGFRAKPVSIVETLSS
jgi:integrase